MAAALLPARIAVRLRVSNVSDHYQIPRELVEFRHKIERSEFLGIAFPVTTEEAFFEELTRIQKKHFDATHHCWAFRLRGGQAISPVRTGGIAHPPPGTVQSEARISAFPVSRLLRFFF